MTKTFASIAMGIAFLSAARVPDKTLASPKGGALFITAQDSETETVLSTLRARVGSEDELQKTLSQEWSTLRKLGLVLAEPHVLLKGKDESGKTIFVEVFTWRDHDAPDDAPAEVQAIWKHLESLCEARLGHRGIEFPEFEIVATP
jgi:hypothetical protein